MFPLADISGNDLIKWGFIFFFFVLPILRSILDKNQKAGRSERRSRREEELQEYAGREAEPDVWEQLLGGDFDPVAVEPEPPKRARAQLSGKKAKALEPSPVYGGVGQPLPSPVAWESSTLGSDRIEFDALPSGEAAQLDPHESVTHLAEFHSTSDDLDLPRERLSKDFASLQDTTQIPATKRRGASGSRTLDWRVAVRTREILGAPVALRTGPAEIPGLR